MEMIDRELETAGTSDAPDSMTKMVIRKRPLWERDCLDHAVV
jgi:hypothetical protein